MPVQKQQSPLMKKYGAKLAQAVAAHANDEPDYGFQRLPGGITGGIAQLKECGFGQVAAGKQNAGEFYFRAMGVVVSPKEFQGQIIEGSQTSILEMVCDTKNAAGKVTTIDDHVKNIQNHLKLLGAEDVTDLEAAAALLQDVQPYFKFSTSLGAKSDKYPEPRVFENWHGIKGLENYSASDAGGVVDNTAASMNGQAHSEPSREDLVAAAGDGDTEAQASLKAAAMEAGHTEEAVDGAEDWGAVAEMIDNPPSAEEGGETPDGGAEPEPEKPAIPEKGLVYKYAPADPKDKTGKKRLKSREVEVTMVYPKTKKVDLIDCENRKVGYKAVSFDLLES